MRGKATLVRSKSLKRLPGWAVDIVGVTGSIPVAPTILRYGLIVPPPAPAGGGGRSGSGPDHREGLAMASDPVDARSWNDERMRALVVDFVENTLEPQRNRTYA